MVKSGNKLKIFGGSLVLCLVMAFNLAGFVSGYTDWTWGLLGGFLAGFGWLAMGIGVLFLFRATILKALPHQCRLFRDFLFGDGVDTWDLEVSAHPS